MSNTKRLFSEDIASGFLGSSMDQSDTDAMLNQMLGILVIGTDTISLDLNVLVNLGNGMKYKITSKDASDEITGLSFYIYPLTKKMPLLPDTAKMVYSQPFLMNKATFEASGGYTVLKEDGTTLNSSLYTISAHGVLTFTTAQTFKYLMIDGLKYEEKVTYTITRNTNGTIKAISSTVL